MLFGKKYRKMAKFYGKLANFYGKCLRDTHKQQQLVLAQGQYTTNILTLVLFSLYKNTPYYACSAWIVLSYVFKVSFLPIGKYNFYEFYA